MIKNLYDRFVGAFLGFWAILTSRNFFLVTLNRKGEVTHGWVDSEGHCSARFMEAVIKVAQEGLNIAQKP